MNESLLLRILAFYIFRFLHYLILLESDIYALLLRFFDKTSSSDEVEVLNIFARFRFNFFDVTRESDFLAFHEKSTLFEEICEEGWFIYSITDRYVYFVKIPTEEEGLLESTISIEKCSKLDNFLFKNGEKLARIQLEVFERVTKSLPPSRSKVLVMHSAPSSGGTTIGKLLQSCDNSKLSLLVIGEPPLLTHLSLLYNKSSIENLRNLCKSTIRFSTMHQKNQQTIVWKARSSCTKIVPFIHSSLPSIQHIFIPRNNYNYVISRMSTKMEVDFDYLQKFEFFGPISSWAELERDTVGWIGPKNNLEIAISQVYGSVMNYHRNRQYFAVDTVFVEDLLSDTASSIRPLLEICEISDLAIPECIEWKRNEEETLRGIWDDVGLDSDGVARVEQFLEMLRQDVFMF